MLKTSLFSIPAKGLVSLFPGSCSVCGSTTPGTVLCGPCNSSVEQAFAHPDCETIADSMALPLYFGAAYRTEVIQLIRRFKFSGCRPSGAVLTGFLASALAATYPGVFGKHTLWVPMPLPALRRLRRDFNQSEAIAYGLHKQLGGVLLAGAVQTSIWRPPVARVAAEQRALIQHKFQARNLLSVLNAALSARDLRPDEAQLCIVDDICTSGSTLVHLARFLRTNGITMPMVAVVLARA